MGRSGQWRVVELPTVVDERGRITVVESPDAPFRIERVYFVSGVPHGERRGGHAHVELEQIVIAVAGGFDVLVDDGCRTDRFRLHRPDLGLHIGPRVWRELVDFTDDAVCLVLASHPYDPDDYVRSYEEFRAGARSS